jgi:hypothetical protein
MQQFIGPLLQLVDPSGQPFGDADDEGQEKHPAQPAYSSW